MILLCTLKLGWRELRIMCWTISPGTSVLSLDRIKFCQITVKVLKNDILSSNVTFSVGLEAKLSGSAGTFRIGAPLLKYIEILQKKKKKYKKEKKKERNKERKK